MSRVYLVSYILLFYSILSCLFMRHHLLLYVLAGSPSPLMLYINSLMHCVYICLNVNFAYTNTCIHAFPWYICLYQLAINYAHYQPYLYEFIVLYSTSNKLRPHFLFLVNLCTIHNRKHKYFCFRHRRLLQRCLHVLENS